MLVFDGVRQNDLFDISSAVTAMADIYKNRRKLVYTKTSIEEKRNGNRIIKIVDGSSEFIVFYF